MFIEYIFRGEDKTTHFVMSEDVEPYYFRLEYQDSEGYVVNFEILTTVDNFLKEQQQEIKNDIIDKLNEWNKINKIPTYIIEFITEKIENYFENDD